MDEARLAVLRRDFIIADALREDLEDEIHKAKAAEKRCRERTGDAVFVLAGLLFAEAHKDAAAAYERRLAELEGEGEG